MYPSGSCKKYLQEHPYRPSIDSQVINILVYYVRRQPNNL